MSCGPQLAPLSVHVFTPQVQQEKVQTTTINLFKIKRNINKLSLLIKLSWKEIVVFLNMGPMFK